MTMMPSEMPPSACSRLKFSRSRSKNGSLLFHSISSAIVPAFERLDVIDLVRLRFLAHAVDDPLTTKLCLCQSWAASALRSRCVPLVSPPPEPMISSIGIVEASRTVSSCAATSGKSTPRIASRVRSELDLEAFFPAAGQTWQSVELFEDIAPAALVRHQGFIHQGS